MRSPQEQLSAGANVRTGVRPAEWWSLFTRAITTSPTNPDFMELAGMVCLNVLPQDLQDPTFKDKVIDAYVSTSGKNPSDKDYNEVRRNMIGQIKAGTNIVGVAGAMMEVKMAEFAEELVSMLNTYCKSRHTAEYTMLLQHVFGVEGRTAIQAAGSNIKFVVIDPIGRGMDVRIEAVGIDGIVAFECKVNSYNTWKNAEAGVNLETQIPSQAANAVLSGKKVFKFTYTVAAMDPAHRTASVSWAGNVEVPFGIEKVLNAWRDPLTPPAPSAEKYMKFILPSRSLLTRDANGVVIDFQFAVEDPDSHQFKGLLSRVPDGNGGFLSLVKWDASTKQFVMEFNLAKYKGSDVRWSVPPSTGHLKVYAAPNGLPDTLTIAEYNMAHVLGENLIDYKIAADGWIKHAANDYSDLTPAERMSNLNVMLNKAMNNLFETTPRTVTFSLGFLVGAPHDTFSAMARLFRVD